MSSYLIKTVAARCRDLRLESNEPQIDLAARAGISLPTLKRFEKAGRISAEGLLSVLHALGWIRPFWRPYGSPQQPPTGQASLRSWQRPRTPENHANAPVVGPSPSPSTL